MRRKYSGARIVLVTGVNPTPHLCANFRMENIYEATLCSLAGSSITIFRQTISSYICTVLSLIYSPLETVDRDSLSY